MFSRVPCELPPNVLPLLGDIVFFLSAELYLLRNFFRYCSYSPISFWSLSAPCMHLRSLFDGLKIFCLIIEVVYQLSILSCSLEKFAVLGHMPVICLNFFLRDISTSFLSTTFSLSSILSCFFNSMSKFYSRCCSTI